MMWRILASGLGLAGVLAVAGCEEDGGAKSTVTIGLITPLTGALAHEGQSWAIVAQLAVDEINAKGGVNGHPLQLVMRDDETIATTSAEMFTELIRDHGIVAAVGPGFSDAVRESVDVAIQYSVPMVSPASTAPPETIPADEGWIFRNVPDDSIQGLAVAYYLKEVMGETNVVVVHEQGSYGAGLAGKFTLAFEARGGTVSATIDYPKNLADAAATNTAVVDKMAPEVTAGTMVVLVALEQDALKIVNACDARGLGVKWFFTDGARSPGFLASGLPASVIGSFGTAPTNPITGDAFGVLSDHWYGGGNTADITDQLYSANTWDAVFLIAAALAQQEYAFPGEPLGGAHLRDSLTTVSRGGQIFHAGRWRDMLASIRLGGDIDYDGASGPCDFDPNGEALGPYEVWTIADNGGVLNFEQVDFLEAGEITGGL